MRRITLVLVLALTPALLNAQSDSTSQGKSPANHPAPGAAISAAARVRLEAMLQFAREHQLPTEPMSDRIAEGEAKGATEAQIIAATQRVEAQLEASQQALIHAGHPAPSGQEIASGAQLLARGATSAQLEAVASHAPSEHRLVVALSVLTELAAKGLPVEHALSVLGSAGANGLTTSGNANAVGSGEISKGGTGANLAGSLTSNLGVSIGRKP
jgi:hypothetical protein